MSKRLEVVVGAQFGSEAKGHVVQRLTERALRDGQYPQVVRVAGPNAGHTGYDPTGRSWALRQVPVAAVVPGQAMLGIAAGSEIDPPVLFDELDQLREAGLLDDKVIWVSTAATVVTDEHKGAENLHNLVGILGSTAKGIGAARADRIWRRANLVSDDVELVEGLDKRGILMTHPAARPTDYQPRDSTVIIEGTQGYGLGLHTEYYPKCTSSDCRASDFMAMAGVNAWEFDEVEVWAVARMYPIRVAGNSGPLINETTWEELGLPEERTTVTKKVRRVGMPDWELVADAVAANGRGPTVRLALTMVDQMFPFIKDRVMSDPQMIFSAEYQKVLAYFAEIEETTRATIELVTTGPNTATFMKRMDR